MPPRNRILSTAVNQHTADNAADRRKPSLLSGVGSDQGTDKWPKQQHRSSSAGRVVYRKASVNRK
jgi:hypothetical protein